MSEFLRAWRFTRHASLLILAILMVSTAAKGQGVSIWGQAVNAGGKPAAFAQVRICAMTASGVPCSPTSSVYGNITLTQPVANPFTTDQYGNFTLFVPGLNAYTVQINVGGGTIYSYIATPGGLHVVTPYLHVSVSPYTDMGAALQAAATANAGSAVLLYPDSGSIPSNVVLGAGQGLYLPASTTLTSTGGYITLANNSTVKCDGGTLASTASAGSPFFYLPAGTQNASIQNCLGESSNPTILAYSPGYTINTLLQNNNLHNMGAYMQQSASSSQPTTGFKGTDNCHFDSNLSSQTCYLFYGALQNFTIDAIADSAFHGVELYAVDASTYPSLATVQSLGLTNGTVRMQCKNIYQSCAWTSGAYNVKIVDSSVDTCGDVGFDLEGSFDSSIDSSMATNCTNGDFSVFYSGGGNSLNNDRAVSFGENGISIRNSSDTPAQQANLTVDHFTFRGATLTSPYTFMYFESSQGTRVQNSDITNGLIAYNASVYQSQQQMLNNTFLWTVPVIFNAGGGTNNGGSGLPMGDFHDNSFSLVSGNSIITTVSQPTYAAISQGISTPNVSEQTLYVGNKIIGPWATDMTFNYSGSNPAFSAMFNLRDNQLAAGRVAKTGTQPVLICTNNFALGSATPYTCP